MWGEWEQGNTYAVRIYHDGIDTYPNNFRCLVEVRDKAGNVYKRKGRGKFIGNFSPIWINFQGERLQLTELLRR